MCSIIACSGDWDKDIVYKILKNSRIRGLHSFGFSYFDKNIKTNKYLDFKNFSDELLDIKPDKFIAHFRYSTSGDWKILDNNQPLNFSNISLVFNGVLDMRTKQEMEEAYKIKMISENDGELAILKYLSGIQNLKNFINDCGKTFAGCFLTEENKIYAIRNKLRPMAISFQEKVTYLTSTTDILKRSDIDKYFIAVPNKLYEF